MVVQHDVLARPLILTNVNFVVQLVAVARAEGLLGFPAVCAMNTDTGYMPCSVGGHSSRWVRVPVHFGYGMT